MITYIKVDEENSSDVSLWMDFDLAVVVENEDLADRFFFPMKDSERKYWSDFLVEGTEFSPPSLKDPFYDRFFILNDDEIVGSYAIPNDVDCYQYLKVQSLYVKKQFRNNGVASQVLNHLQDVSKQKSLMGISLETSWNWRSTLDFYLHRGFWLLHWKDFLYLIKGWFHPEYEVIVEGNTVEFWVCLDDTKHCMIRAVRSGEWLKWTEPNIDTPDSDRLECIMTDARTTFSLHLALLGWPLKRSEKHWKNRSSYCDCNGPEGLAEKIMFWEGEGDDDD